MFKFGECHVWRFISYASIFGEFYFSEFKEPHETRVIKLSRKLSILQYMYRLYFFIGVQIAKLHSQCYSYGLGNLGSNEEIQSSSADFEHHVKRPKIHSCALDITKDSKC